MLKNYLLVAFRNIKRQKGYSFINIAGLAIGMAIFLLTMLYIQFELGYDRFHEKSDRIYRLIKKLGYPGGFEYRADGGAPMGPMLLQNLPQIENTVRFLTFDGMIKQNDRQFNESKFYFTDPSIFEVFSFNLSQGNPQTALKEPFTVLITENMAEKYFGNDDPVNKVLRFNPSFSNKYIELKVTGVLKNIPQNSHLQIDFLASFETLKSIIPPSFFTSRWDSPVSTYILLRAETRKEEVEKVLPELAQKYVDRGGYSSLSLELQPLNDIYFNSSKIGGGSWKTGDRDNLYIFSAVAIFILLIACLNYMNLATARSIKRSKEVGMRKVLGGGRRQLILQFIGESLFYSFLSVAFSILIVELLIPTFKNLTGIYLQTNYFNNYTYLIIIVITSLFVGIISGTYPAFFLSASTPEKILRGSQPTGSAAFLRKGLVIFQFAISIILIFGTIIIYKQVHHLKTKELGFNKENIVTIPIQDQNTLRKYPLIKDEISKDARIKSITAASGVPGLTDPNGIYLSSENIEDQQMTIVYVDFDYAKTLELKLSEGKDFQKEIMTDMNNSVLVNKSFLTKMNWQSGTGKDLELYFKEADRKIPMYSTKVVGVVEDFNFRDLSYSIQPVIFKIEPGRFNTFIVRLNPGDHIQTIDFIKNIFKNFFPDQPFEFSFLDQEIENAYKKHAIFGAMVLYLTFLAIFIACLGLFGLVSYSAEQRTKEIGIRKALGATAPNIVIMLSREFLKWVIVSCVFALPIGYYLMDKWLENFVYRININIWTFLLSGLFILVVALITLSYQSIKAALTDPVKALRYE
jgi:putative ABC transport system permease protein